MLTESKYFVKGQDRMFFRWLLLYNERKDGYNNISPLYNKRGLPAAMAPDGKMREETERRAS